MKMWQPAVLDVTADRASEAMSVSPATSPADDRVVDDDDPATQVDIAGLNVDDCAQHALLKVLTGAGS